MCFTSLHSPHTERMWDKKRGVVRLTPEDIRRAKDPKLQVKPEALDTRMLKFVDILNNRLVSVERRLAALERGR